MSFNGEYEPSAWEMVRDQVALFEESNGTQGNTMGDRPIVVVTMMGAKSGKIRKVPVMRVEEGGRYAVVASLGGAPKHPTWYHNIKADPVVELQDGGERGRYTAHEASGAERDEWWRRAVEAFPDYAEYQLKTERVIPVFVMEPVTSASPTPE